jgi:DNA modification methylase
MFSFVGDVVLDPFAGTGTTLLAALKWGREAIGVELVPRYAKLAEECLARELPGAELKVAPTGRTQVVEG